MTATALGGTTLTYGDWAKRVNDDGKVATIINLLSQTNEMLLDMLVIEGNLVNGHKSTVRTGLPPSTWRLMYGGIVKGKSTTAQVVDTVGNLEGLSEIDVDIADLNGGTAEFRLSEDLSFLESMNQTVAGTAIYGNTAVNPERFMGLAPRFNSTASSNTGANVIDAGGTLSVNTSLWIVVWGPRTCASFFPKGKISGLQQTDEGKWWVNDANGNPYKAYRTHFKWEMGLTVPDWRYIVRIANIDVNNLQTGSAANLINALIRGVHRLPTAPVSASTEQETDAPDKGAMSMGQTVIYCNRTVRTYLDIQATNKNNVLLKLDEWDGKPVTLFRGIPVRTVDQILNTEARVV